LQDELGSDYRLDPTHFIEFRQPVFREEMTAAGLVIDELIPVWGELWCRLHPVQAEQG